MTDDIKAIRDALADPDLTHGEWVACGPSFGDPLPRYLNEVVRPDDVDGGDTVARAMEGMEGGSTADMAYIAACHPERIARLLDALEAAKKDAALVRAQADAEASERLSIIADELIAGLGEPGRGLAEMLREGIVALESYAASVVLDVRRQALEEAARVCESEPERRRGDGVWAADQTACAQAVRALKDKP